MAISIGLVDSLLKDIGALKQMFSASLFQMGKYQGLIAPLFEGDKLKVEVKLGEEKQAMQVFPPETNSAMYQASDETIKALIQF